MEDGLNRTIYCFTDLNKLPTHSTLDPHALLPKVESPISKWGIPDRSWPIRTVVLQSVPDSVAYGNTRYGHTFIFLNLLD